MKRWFFILATLFAAPAFAAAGHAHGHALVAAVTVDGSLEVGKAVPVTLTLTHAKSGRPVTPEEIAVMHTQRVHLLVIDQSLTDYQHIHPEPGENGQWHFSFTPKKPGAYRIWVDVTPQGGDQEYIKADIGTKLSPAPTIGKAGASNAAVGGYRFALELEDPLKARQASMGTITVTDANGQPVKELQPVMGAYAHIVGFTEGGNSVLHVHPLGEEPASDDDRGGPELTFHLEPGKSGPIKLFVQVKIGGEDIFAPFMLKVAR